MRYSKQVVAKMRLCYAIGILRGANAGSFVIGTEKDGPLVRFSADGERMETVSAGPGGVMTIVPVLGRDDQLLATSRFFSPNFGGDEAEIVSHTLGADGSWAESLVCRLPYVHRFGLLAGADGRRWLLACTIKGSCRRVKGDWTRPGAIWAAPLDADPASYAAGRELVLTEICGCQLQNHGFWAASDASFALVSTAAGVFRCTPPAAPGASWDVTCLVVEPTSDVCAVDLDGDGVDEILTISPFHGDAMSIWRQAGAADMYERVWSAPKRREFLHAIWGGRFEGALCALIGARQGERELLRVFCEKGRYQVEVIDRGSGPANCAVIRHGGRDRIIAANRETDEVAIYTATGA